MPRKISNWKPKVAEGGCHGEMKTYAAACDRKPTVTRDGKGYCWQHDPVRLDAIAAKKWAERKAATALFEAEMDARDARRALEKRADVKDITNAELEQIAELGGLRKLLSEALNKRK